VVVVPPVFSSPAEVKVKLEEDTQKIGRKIENCVVFKDKRKTQEEKSDYLD
jgi:hypothetical protein